MKCVVESTGFLSEKPNWQPVEGGKGSAYEDRGMRLDCVEFVLREVVSRLGLGL